MSADPASLCDPGSFRDPSGRVLLRGGRVFRVIAPEAVGEFDFAQANEGLRGLIAKGAVVESRAVAANDAGAPKADAARIVEHPAIPFLSYPYEWSFSLLKAAALHHLDLQLALLPGGVSLSDATAYNVQFIGPRPIFIDALSFQRYQDGDYWTAHRQFCEQFLNPLLLRALFGVAHNDWFRGALEGVPGATIAALLPAHRRLSLRLQAHVLLPARMQAKGEGAARAATVRPLPRFAYLGLLRQLRDWIAALEPKGAGRTTWADYERNNSYDAAEEDAKRRAVGAFAASVRPELLLDFGCNSGAYSEVALSSGARRVVGFDFDQGALEAAYDRALSRKLEFLPLFQDAANPSPPQGWAGEERRGLTARASNAGALVALAFIHHIAIGRNVPLDRAVDWLIAMAPTGVIEFVPKADPMVGRLLALRKDIFPDYSLDAFRAHVSRRARIVSMETVTASGRTLVHYERA